MGASDLGNKEIFGKNLRYYMMLNHVDRNKLCDDLGFNYTTVREWTNGTAYPRIDKIEMMANYFGIQKSDLIENKYQEENAKIDETDVLFDKYKGVLTESDKEIIKTIIEQRKKEIDKQLGED